MIVLDKSTMKLQAVLGGAVSANQVQFNVAYSDENNQGIDTKYASQQATSNSTTDADICAAPQVNFVRNIETLTAYNADTASVALTIKIDNSGVETILVKQTLLTLETLAYEDGAGWQII